MKIKKIISKRNIKYIWSIRTWRKKPRFAFDIVWEWEDIISQVCNIKIENETLLKMTLLEYLSYSSLLCLLYSLFRNKNKLSLYFILKVKLKQNPYLNRSVVPILIDFWLQENEFTLFYKLYRKCPLVFITNREVFDLLKSKNCPLNIIHYPLSLPDKYFLDENTLLIKEYDLVLNGRIDQYFKCMLDKYCVEYPELVYVRNENVGNEKKYITNKGNILCDASRENYFMMIKKAKVTFYSTPGIDESKIGANNYNQVTPRFLELLSGGCYILAHYPANSDTEFYEMDTICDNIHSYEQFKERMNYYRSTPDSPIKRNAQYLKRHYTSYTSQYLKENLSTIGLI